MIKLPVTLAPPVGVLTITHAWEPDRMGLKVLLDPLKIVHEVSVGRNPVPLTMTSVPIVPLEGVRVIAGPDVTLNMASAWSMYGMP
jgi:hypothetical protein